MPTAISHLSRGDELDVFDYRCRERRGRSGRPEAIAAWEIVFVRRGIFVARVGLEERVGTPAQLVLFKPGEVYQVDHPFEGGDDCTVIALSDSAVEELCGGAAARAFMRGTAPAPSAAYASQLSFRSGELTAQERAWTIAAAALASIAPRREPSSEGVRRRQLRVVRQTLELISACYARHLTLPQIARQVGASPYHLIRLFRIHTGRTLHRYIASLRLRIAAARIADGERDLTALALDVGYAHHSHFTNAFKREFGVPPSVFRARNISQAPA